MVPLSIPLAVQIKMSGKSSSSKEVMEFLTEYRVLECSCCQQVFGFQHKGTGALFCVKGCHEGAGSNPPVRPPLPAALLKLEDEGSADGPVSVAKPAARAQPPVQMNGVDRVDSGGAAAKAKPAAPKPVEPAPKPAAPKPAPPPVKRYMWNEMKFSSNLLAPEASVRVQFSWTPALYTVSADADEEDMAKLCTMLKTYADSVKPLDRVAVKDEIVIAEYEGEFYRARVSNVNGNQCDLVFIDYGDKKTCKTSEMFPINDAFMKLPVYGMIVQLKVPVPVDNHRLSPELEESIYGESFILVLKKGVNPAPGQADFFEVRMWDSEKENTLNERVTADISNARTSPGMTQEEEKEMEHFMNEHPYFGDVKHLIEEDMREGDPNYVIKLDKADCKYTIQDLPLVKPSLVKDEIRVQITRFRSLSDIVAVPLGEPFHSERNKISEEIRLFMESRKTKQLRELKQFEPAKDQMYLVQWPDWSSLSEHLKPTPNKKWNPMDEYLIDPHMQMFWKGYQRNQGKWFRAACETKVNLERIGAEYNNVLYRMFLVDLGISALIPGENVFGFPHRFAYDYQWSLFLNVMLDNIVQYDGAAETEKWQYLLLPGITLKVKIVWMVDEINIVKLVQPSEHDFDLHFLKPEVRKAIEATKTTARKHELHQRVKRTSMKATFKKNLKKAMAEEEEASKLKPFEDAYAGVGRVHPSRIFELRFPD